MALGMVGDGFGVAFLHQARVRISREPVLRMLPRSIHYNAPPRASPRIQFDAYAIAQAEALPTYQRDPETCVLQTRHASALCGSRYPRPRA